MTLPAATFLVHILVAIIGAAVALRATRALASEFLSAVLFGGFALVYGLAPLFLPTGKNSTLAAVTCLSSVIGLVLGRSVARATFGTPTRMATAIFDRRTMYRYIGGTQFLGIVGAIAYAYGSAGSLGSYLASGRFAYRLNPHSQTLSLVGLYLLAFLCVPPLLMISTRGRQRLGGAAWGIITILFLFYFLKGTRSLPMGLLVAMIVFATVGHHQQQTSVRAGRKIAAIIIAGTVGVIALPNMYQARHLLSSENVSATEIFIGSDSRSSATGGIFNQDPLNYSEYLEAAVVVFPQQEGYLWLYPLRRLAFFPVPSSISALKPPDTNKVFAQAIGHGANETTIPPSLPGEGYIVAGGVLGAALWAVLYGLGLGWIEARLNRAYVGLTVLTVGVPAALLALRGQLYELVLQIALTLVVSVIITRMITSEKECAPGAPSRRSNGRSGGPRSR